MKKVWIIFVGLAVAAVAAGLIVMLAPDAKKIRVILDSQGKQAVEAYLKAETGKDIALTYAKAEDTSDGLLLHDLTLAEKADPNKKIVAKTALLSELVIDTEGWGMSATFNDVVGGPGGRGGLRGQAIELSKVKVSHDGKSATMAAFKAKDLSLADDDADLRLAEAEMTGFQLENGNLVKISKGSLKNLSGQPEKGGQLRLDELNFEGLQTHSDEQFFVLNVGGLGGLKATAPGYDVAIGGAYVEGLYLDKENVFRLGKAEAKEFKCVAEGDGLEFSLFSLAGVAQMDFDEPETWHFGAGKLENVIVHGGGAKLASIASLDSATTNNNSVIAFSLNLRELWISTDSMDPAERAQMEAMGVKQIKFDAAMAYEADLKKNTLDVKEISLKGQDLGQLTLRAAFGEIKLDPNDVGRSLEASANVITMASGEFAYEDGGLVRQIIVAQAKEAGVSADQFVEQQSAPMMAMAKQSGGQEMLALAEAMDKFLKNPVKLVVKVQPEKPVKLMDLGAMDPAAMLKLLRVTAQAN